jgi:hypothetical protein
MNWYDYVGGDPVNKVDPTGLRDLPGTVVVMGPKSCTIYRQSTCSTTISEVPATRSLPLPYARRVFTPSACLINYIGSLLAHTDRRFDLGDIRFLEELDASANPFTRLAFLRPGTTATTQDNTVYVKREYWEVAIDPKNTLLYEEIYHSTQFSQLGSFRFYLSYLISSAHQRGMMKDDYLDNAFEKEAKLFADQAAAAYKPEICAH